MNKPAGIRDVARETGVSTFVVSRALRGLPGVAPQTRARVETAAARLGYQANVAGALLARGRSGQVAQKILVGLLAEGPCEEAAYRLACAEIGWIGNIYQVNEFKSVQQASRVLWQEGVDAVIVGTGPHDMPFWKQIGDLEWDKFSVVKLMRGLPELPVAMVWHSAFDYMTMTLETVFSRGYRRVAILLHESVSAQDDRARLGAALAFREEHVNERGFACTWMRLPVPSSEKNTIDTTCVQWLRSFAPDVIVADIYFLHYYLFKVWSVPSGVGLAAVQATPFRWDNHPWISGCDIRHVDTYKQALNILEKQIQYGQRGFSQYPIESVIEPIWIEGDTLPVIYQSTTPVFRDGGR